MINIAITGANGFVGKNLVFYLQQHYNVFSITRDTLDLFDLEAIKSFFVKNEIDVVIHSATSSAQRFKSDNADSIEISENLRMFSNLENCLTNNMKMIAFGSGAQYAKTREICKVSENELGKSVPTDSYGFGKYIISRALNPNKNIYIPVIFGLFGRFEDYKIKFVSNAIIKNILQLPIEINQNVVFDYLYIDDFLNIIDLYINNDYKNKMFNITPTKSIDLVSIAKIINSCSDFKSEIIVLHDGNNFEYTGGNKMMLSDIGDYGFMSYEDSIANLYNYYRINIDRLDTEAIILDEYIKKCKTRL